MAASSARRRKQQKRYLMLAGGTLVLVSLLSGHWLLALLVLLLLYLAHELLLADHIFYPPRSDYRYHLSAPRLQYQWQEDQLSVVGSAPVGDTLLLEVPVLASLTGRWFDPCVVVSAGECSSRQFLERGVRARRFINLSAVADPLATGQPVRIRGEHCRVERSDGILWSFDNSTLANAPMLVLAPHADDAEIAAFGLYSQAPECSVVTVTAGETEVEQFADWCDDKHQASRFKGEVRSLDSVAAALWAGLHQEQCINLGYGCLQLQEMQQRMDVSITSPWSGLADTRPYRRFNRLALASDDNGNTTWNNLVADLAELLAMQQPQLLVCPHPILDTHSDHRYASLALWQAWQATDLPAPRWLLYANHLDASQDFSFGPPHSETGLPPSVQQEVPIRGLYSVGLDADLRRRKALALDLMHDLRRPVVRKKWWRKRLQQLFLRRPLNPYGEDEFFRKAVRRSELFIVADEQQMAELLEALD